MLVKQTYRVTLSSEDPLMEDIVQEFDTFIDLFFPSLFFLKDLKN